MLWWEDDNISINRSRNSLISKVICKNHNRNDVESIDINISFNSLDISYLILLLNILCHIFSIAYIDKTEQDMEREQSLVDQWVSLTEERNAVLVPAAGSGIPGAPADWTPPAGMEPHIPVLFLDLNGTAIYFGDTIRWIEKLPFH